MSYYSYGTSARAIENSEIENKNNQSEKLRKINRQRAIKIRKMKMKIILSILSMGFITFLMIFQNAMINDEFNRLNALKKEYESVKNEVDLLRIDLERQVDLNKVEEIAYGKLGMQKPDSSQIVYINVNETDVCEVIKEKNVFKVALNGITQKINGVLEYLY